MKFKKLDDKTVCCMVSTEDLSDNNITIEDFIQNKDKVQDFLEEVVEAAKRIHFFQRRRRTVDYSVILDVSCKGGDFLSADRE